MLADTTSTCTCIISSFSLIVIYLALIHPRSRALLAASYRPRLGIHLCTHLHTDTIP